MKDPDNKAYEYTTHDFNSVNVFVDEEVKKNKEILLRRRVTIFERIVKAITIGILILALAYLLYAIAEWFLSEPKGSAQCNQQCSNFDAVTPRSNETMIQNNTAEQVDPNATTNELDAKQMQSEIKENINSETSEEAGNEVITEEDLQVCKLKTASGNKEPRIIKMDLNKASGQIKLRYETYTAKDLVRVVYEDKVVFDSGCVGTDGWKEQLINYQGSSKQVDIHVLPNCLGTEPKTKWKLDAICSGE